MCSIGSHEKKNPSYVEDGSSGGGKSIPPNLITEALDSLSAIYDFIDYWLK